MGGRVQLIVAEPLEGDHGIARLDEATMKYIEVEPGEEVEIYGVIFSPAHVSVKVEKATQEDEGKGIVRIARDKMREGDFRPGMMVTVERSWLQTLKDSLTEKSARRRLKRKAEDLPRSGGGGLPKTKRSGGI